MKSLLPIVLRLFAGKVSSVLASGVLWLVLFGVGKVAALSPELAATIPINETANWIFAALVVVLNAVTNKYHLDNMDNLLTVMKQKEGTLQVEVKRAEPVK